MYIHSEISWLIVTASPINRSVFTLNVLSPKTMQIYINKCAQWYETLAFDNRTQWSHKDEQQLRFSMLSRNVLCFFYNQHVVSHFLSDIQAKACETFPLYHMLTHVSRRNVSLNRIFFNFQTRNCMTSLIARICQQLWLLEYPNCLKYLFSVNFYCNRY